MIIVKYIFEDLTWYPSLTAKSKFLTFSVGIWRKVQMLKCYCNHHLLFCEILFVLIDHDLVCLININMSIVSNVVSTPWIKSLDPPMPWQNVLLGFPPLVCISGGEFPIHCKIFFVIWYNTLYLSTLNIWLKTE